MSLEQYAESRNEFRANVLAHKQNRRLHIGPNASLYFEDRLTIQYQIQEMLRIEKIFDAQGINEELEAYNPLIPDGSNWKATFMVEFPDAQQRRVALTELVGIEYKVWVGCGEADRVWAIADEDLERTTDEKTSAVHFLRFELHDEFITSVKQGERISAGIDHQNYRFSVNLPDPVQQSLAADLA